MPRSSRKGKSKTISGITTDDATGKITIKLLAPYGAFGNVLAFPALGIVPTGSPMKNEPNSPPPGVGPYMISNIVPNASFSEVKNPNWAAMNIPGIPAGKVNVNVKISSNVDANALAVLQNSADVFDWADTVPGSLLPQIQSQAKDRYSKKVMNSTYYFFLNTKTKPFSSQLAREAVVTGMDQNALSRLGCRRADPRVLLHSRRAWSVIRRHRARTVIRPAAATSPRPRQLVQQSGMAGTPVTVWSETRSPRQQWAAYYTDFLNKIGFKATQKVIADATYFTTIGNLKLNPQTGFADWNQDFPNPIDFYLLLQSTAIQPTNNQNFGQVKDPQVDSQSTQLGQVPTSKLPTIASKWQALDEYVAKKAYVGVYGYLSFPAFTSNRIDLSSADIPPVVRMGLELIRDQVATGWAGTARLSRPIVYGDNFRFRHRVLRRPPDHRR